MSDIKTIHPEIAYAERSSVSEPEKVRCAVSVEGSVIWTFEDQGRAWTMAIRNASKEMEPSGNDSR
jgi:hypothetical protein